jgi:hypothetical protein
MIQGEEDRQSKSEFKILAFSAQAGMRAVRHGRPLSFLGAVWVSSARKKAEPGGAGLSRATSEIGMLLIARWLPLAIFARRDHPCSVPSLSAGRAYCSTNINLVRESLPGGQADFRAS